MPMNRKLYPTDWEAISHRIRFERARGMCEKCGAPHGKDIVRSSKDRTQFIVYNDETMGYETVSGIPIRLSEIPDEFDIMHHVPVILTTAHYPDPTPSNVSDDNLLALCQMCHNRLDAPARAKNAALTRAQKKREARRDEGQLSLFGDTP